MKKLLVLLAAVVLVLLASSVSPWTSQDEKKDEKKKPADTWAVVQVGDALEVLASKSAATRGKAVAAEDALALKTWKEAKAAAKKAKTKFEDPRPKKRAVKIVKNKLETEAEANALRDKMVAEQKKRKKGDGETGGKKKGGGKKKKEEKGGGGR